MRPLHSSITIDDLTLEEFKRVAVPGAYLDWIRIDSPSEHGIIHATYDLNERRLETLGLDMRHDQFCKLELRWSIASFVLESEDATYIAPPVHKRGTAYSIEGWKRAHWFDRTPTSDELVRELELSNTHDTRITACYGDVPTTHPIPKEAHTWRIIER